MQRQVQRMKTRLRRSLLPCDGSTSMHHHRTSPNKCHIGYSDRVGMQYFHKLRNRFYSPIVNTDELWSLVSREVKDKASNDSAPPIDVTQYGYFKVWVRAFYRRINLWR